MCNDDLLKSEWSHISQNVQRLSNHQFGGCQFFLLTFLWKVMWFNLNFGFIYSFQRYSQYDRECHKRHVNFFFLKKIWWHTLHHNFFNARPNCINCCIISHFMSQKKVYIMWLFAVLRAYTRKGNICTFSIGCNVSIFRNIPIYRDNWMSP